MVGRRGGGAGSLGAMSDHMAGPMEIVISMVWGS